MASSRTAILDAALDILRDPDGPALTLESAARGAGVSKPGLMYHFPTKEALVRGVLEHSVAGWEQRIREHLDAPLDEATPSQRIRAYVETALSSELDRADLATFFDVHYRTELATIWDDRMAPFLELPADLDPGERARLTVARLAADGYWFATMSGSSVGDPDQIGAAIRALTEVR